jgi:membrane-associated phospholipid phosphatase
LPVTAAFWLSPTVGSPGSRMFAVNLFVCLLFDLLVVGTIKSVVRRKRPHYNRGHFVVVSVDSWSFPSGHSTRAVMVVTLIWLYTPLWQTTANLSENPFLTEYILPHHLLAIAYCFVMLWMVATACSRVVLGRHYISDVLGGVLIGVLEALVAHFCLHVPLKVSELQHAYLLARFGLYEEAFWRFFSSHHQFREAEQGVM